MTIAILSVGLVTCAIAIGLLTYLIIQTHIEVKALTRSTHSVQFVPATDFEKLTEKTREQLEKEYFDNIQ